MLANTTHGLRTPLNGSLNAIHLLEDQVSEEGRVYLNIARTSNHMLSNLVEDMLDMTRLTQGTFTLSMAPFLLSDLKESLEDLFGLQAK